MTGFGATDVNRIYFGIADAAVPASWDSGNNIPYFAAGTPDSSSGIYLGALQVEEGSFPSSYIPTSSTATTRAADLISLIGNADTIVHGTTGSIVADATIYDDPSLIGNARILSEQSGHSPLFVNLNTDVNSYLYISGGNMSATLRQWSYLDYGG